MKRYTLFFIIPLYLLSQTICSQTTEKKELSKLSFLAGDWIGTSTAFKKDGTNTIAVREKIDYEMDGEILVVRLKSSRLKLHTIIQYSVTDSCYYYYPFTKNSQGKYKGELIDGKFLVWLNNKSRLIFEKTATGIHEYGETLENDKWIKYFEDELQPNQQLQISPSKVSVDHIPHIGENAGYSDIVSVNNQNSKTLYVSGQVGEGKTIEEQFETAFRAIEEKLKQAKATLQTRSKNEYLYSRTQSKNRFRHIS